MNGGCCSASGHGFDTQAKSQFLAELFAEIEANARRLGAAPAAVAACKALIKDPVNVLRRDADPIVSNGEKNLSAVTGAGNSDLSWGGRAVVQVFQRIVQKLAKDKISPFGIGKYFMFQPAGGKFDFLTDESFSGFSYDRVYQVLKTRFFDNIVLFDAAAARIKKSLIHITLNLVDFLTE